MAISDSPGVISAGPGPRHHALDAAGFSRLPSEPLWAEAKIWLWVKTNSTILGQVHRPFQWL